MKKDSKFDKEAQYLLDLVSEECGVEIDRLLSKCRKKEVVSAKRIFIKVFHIFFKDRITYGYIGTKVGHMNHATICHHLKVHALDEEIKDVDKRLQVYFKQFENVHMEFSKVIGYSNKPSPDKIKNLKIAKKIMEERISSMERDYILINRRVRQERKEEFRKSRKCNKIEPNFV